jgi:hypothetical protein
MGTRASFWIGDPRNLDNRELLGCIAWDGYPEGVPELERAKTEEEFRQIIGTFKNREDFALPENGWPFPWESNIFLTGCTYAFFDNKLHYCWFSKPFVEWPKEIPDDAEDDPTKINVPAPSEYNPQQPDSIIIIQAKEGS